MINKEIMAKITESLYSQIQIELGGSHEDCLACQIKSYLEEDEYARACCNGFVNFTLNTGQLHALTFMSAMVIGVELGIAYAEAKQLEELIK
jgi:hypothetical protein